MKKVLILSTLISQFFTAQLITGNLLEHKNTEIALAIYDGTQQTLYTKGVTDEQGNFSMEYPIDYKGAAIFQVRDGGSVILLLNQENIKLDWKNSKEMGSLKFENSLENDVFSKAMEVNQQAQQKLAGLKYLLPLYEKEINTQQWLAKEIQKQEGLFPDFVNTISNNLYAKKYLLLRKFLEELQSAVNSKNEVNNLSSYENQLLTIDFSEDALWYSGLLPELLGNYYYLLDRYKDQEVINQNAIKANHVWMSSLKNKPQRLTQIAEFCFMMLERKSSTKASEHIALEMLNSYRDQLDTRQVNIYEQYGNMAIGKTAPNISLSHPKYKTLKDIPTQYKLVVFGSSTCPECNNQYPSLVGVYKKLKPKQSLEMVYISLDSNKKDFLNYYKEAPFITQFDGKGWEGEAVKSYHVFATPTYVLLDKDLKILSKLERPEQLEIILEKLTIAKK